MKRVDTPADVERFRSLILARLGLQFEDSKTGFLAELIQQRLNETQLSPNDYLRLLEYDSTEAELPLLAKELTVPETYFFRNFDQFRAFRDLVVPERLQKSASKKINVLSAGCASGEETYSLAMVMLSMGLSAANMSVKGIDINPVALKKARRGRYSAWAFRETPQEQQQRWFKPEGRDFAIDEGVRKAVVFQECNLAAPNEALWLPNSFDVIFCRNVLMYFSPERARAVIAQMTKALAPGGYLFLGHAETMRGWSEDFHLCHTHGAFYYRVRDERERADPVTDFRWPTSLPASPLEPPPITEDWIESIHRASERVQALSTSPPKSRTKVAVAARPLPVRQSSPRSDISPVFALLHGDRFDDALAHVRSLPQTATEDPDVLLVEAMLLAHAGKTAEAEDVCQNLLRIDEMNASAHHVLALCREAGGDLDGAMEQDRIAAYLDPTFAMPHLHMGLLGRRSGNRELARRELATALPLLKYEDSARLMLFGGGFNRQSMIELCASALRDCGGAP